MSINNRFFRLIRLLFGILILYNYTHALQSNSKPAKMEAREASSNKVRVGQTFFIKLTTNPTTGYDWYCTIDATNIIRLEQETLISDEKDGKTGAPSLKTWKFRADKPGHTKIRFRYYRSWEGETNAIDCKFYNIKVSGK